MLIGVSGEHDPTSALRTFAERIFARSQPEAAGDALHALLRDRLPADVYRAEIDRIFREAHLGEAARSRLCDQIWRRAMEVFVEDDHLSQAEAGYLWDLRALLQVPEDTVMAAESELLYPKLRALAQRALVDGTVPVEEWARVADVAIALRISPMVAGQILADTIAEHLP